MLRVGTKVALENISSRAGLLCLKLLMKEIRLIAQASFPTRGSGMPCKSCGSVNRRKFSAEMGIHFLGQKNIDRPVAWVFSEVVVCLDCGTAEFTVPEVELRQLAKADAAAAE